MTDSLRSTAIDYLDGIRGADGERKIGIAYFYFKYDDREHQSGDQVAANLLKQLIYQIDALPTPLAKMYLDSKGGFPPKQSAVLDLMFSCATKFTTVYIFFDGLDECTDDQHDEILVLIGRLCATTIRIFLTSQPQLMPRVAEIGEYVSREIIASEEDLESYIKQRFEVAKTEIKEPLLQELVSGAEGMYGSPFTAA